MRVPLFIEVKDRNVLIIGGGSTGTKRARKFSLAGANVVVLSKEFTNELIQLSRDLGVVLIQVDLSVPDSLPVLETWIRWSDMVVYTIPDNMLASIVHLLCKRHRKFLNDATSAERTEVVVPFEAKILDSVRVAVTTEGRSSTLSRILVRKIESMLSTDLELKNLANALFTMKRILKENVKDYKTRMRLYEELSNDSKFIELAVKGNIDEVTRYVMSKISEHSC